MPKNIVICCDGTGNEIKENLSNVLKLYRILKKNEQQVCFYDPGVGTISDSGAWARRKNQAKGIFGLATGYGLDANVLDAYRFLLQHYEDKDQIYLFGFSRGAYTVRALAGFLTLVGLLQREQAHLAGYALTAYKQASNKDDFKIAWRVQEILGTRHVPIHFLGCWDTVGSVIIPRPDRFYLVPSLESLPYTKKNPLVRAFRHAIAIDERRRMFRLADWTEPQVFKSNPFVPDEKAGQQDIKQVWFVGVHTDIGGGYPEDESGLAKIPLDWMIGEAAAEGLAISEKRREYYALGNTPENHRRRYAKPDPAGMLHNSLSGAWPVLEWLPRQAKRMEWPERKAVLGLYLPRGEPRPIPAGATIHPSVWERKRAGLQPPYDPENLPPAPPPSQMESKPLE